MENKAIKCDTCQKIFSYRWDLKNHLNTVHNKVKKHKCDVCFKPFAKLYNLKVHVTTIHDREKRFKCEFCDKCFSQKSHQVRHVDSFHIKGYKTFKFACAICNKKFEEKVYLDNHKGKFHSQISVFTCDLCGKCFNHETDFHWHKNVVHKNETGDFKKVQKKTVECETCFKIFSTKGHLEEHVRAVHDKVKNFECDVCLMTFYKRWNWKTHITSVHVKEKKTRYVDKIKCDICDFYFTTTFDLKVHVQNIHNEEKTFECDSCGKSFAQKCQLQSHTRKEHIMDGIRGDEKTNCESCSLTHCTEHSLKLNDHPINNSNDMESKPIPKPKNFKEEKANLVNHTYEFNSQLSVFTCDLCNKCFNNENDFHWHKNDFHKKKKKVKKVQCDICFKTFTRKQHVKRHKNKIHHGHGIFKCDSCEKDFVFKEDLDLHQFKTQSEEEPHDSTKGPKNTKRENSVELSDIVKSINATHFECGTCGENFDRTSNLKIHISFKHGKSNKKKFACDTCKVGFTAKLSLQRHILVKHVGVKDFDCMYCGKLFAQKEAWQYHIDFHENNKSKKCAYCEKCFVTKSELNVHIDKCCSKTKFDKEEDEIAHSDSSNHTITKRKELARPKNEMEKAHVLKIKNFKCERCDSEFFNNSSLKIHIAFIHDKTITI